MIPNSLLFDQSTLARLLEHDTLVQRYRRFFALLDLSALEKGQAARCVPGPCPHPETAYLKAFLVRICEEKRFMTQLRAFLVEHPLLVIELGFHLVLDETQPYGFDVQRTVPSDRWWREKLRRLDSTLLQGVLQATVQALQAEIPGLGEVIAVDVKHLYAWVAANNPRVSMGWRFLPANQPGGDPDCRVGVKKSTNQERADGSTHVKKEYLWGYGSGVVAALTADYGDVVLAEYTHPFNQTDVTYFRPLYQRTVIALNQYPTHLTADAAYDAWYVYECAARHGGIGAVPLNEHHPGLLRDPDGTPRCAKGLRMTPTFQFDHSYGYRAQRFRCPLLFPERTGASCDHEQFAKGKGGLKDANWEAGGLQRVLLDRESPLYHAVYSQRTSCERINSQAQALGIERPKVRNGQSVNHLNTLIYIVINARALQRAQSINTRLLFRE